MRNTRALPFLATLALTACSDQLPSTSQLDLANGIVVDEADEEYRNIIKVWGAGRCTGAFISPTVVVTAAHCTARNETGRTLSIGETAATRVHYSKEYDRYEDPAYADLGAPYDMVLAVFPEQISKDLGITKFRKFATGAPSVGSTVTVVGYGVEDIAVEEGYGTKRRGTNRIASRYDGTIQLRGHSRPTSSLGDEVGIGPGDSGGPLLNAQGEIIGISSYLTGVDRWEHTHDSYFADVQNPHSSSLIQELSQCEASGICTGTVPSAPPPNTCLSKSEVKEFLQFLIMENDGPLRSDLQKRKDELGARRKQYGNCDEIRR